MAKPARKTAEEIKDYGSLIKELRTEGAKPVYLVCGQELFLQERLISAIAGQWLEEEISDFNYAKEDGAKLSAGQAADLANQMPFSPRKSF